jgi:hypothetical protein
LIQRQRHPDLRLIIAGRDYNKAKQLADSLGSAEGVVMDVTKVDPLSTPFDIPGGNVAVGAGITFPGLHEDIDKALATLQ